MICNHTLVKYIIVVAGIVILSGCSNLPSVFQINKPEEQENPQAQTSDNSTGDKASETPATGLAEHDQTRVIIQNLFAQTDLFEQAKISLSPSTKSKMLDVIELYNKSEYEQSQKAINRILQTELITNSSVYVLAGDIALANNQTNQAIQHYQQALSVNQYNPKAANRLAKQYRMKGEFEKAEKLYNAAIDASPTRAQSYRNRAILYDLYMHKKDKALEDYEMYSALLKHALQAHTNSAQNVSDKLNETQIKRLKKDIKTVDRWLLDVGRQLAALGKRDSASSGN